MKYRVLMVAVLGLAGLMLAGSASGADDEVPSIKDVMKKVNGKEGLKGVIAKDLKAKEVNWDEAKAHGEALVKLAEAMGKNTPPKGDEKAWAKVAEAYLKGAQDIEAAIAKKDAKTVAALHGKFFAGNTCSSCHGAFKGK